ncbi:MAG: pentapeptide repeat-containing protein [Bacteroidales bacterium]|jgi:hypothetical protein|nr:pentapeptide repeat-containing protein [Bacteroidales bacterium]
MYRLVLLIVSAFICFSCNGADKKEIKASEILKLIKKDKPVHVVNKIIVNDLDFTVNSTPFIVNANSLQNEISSNIFFSNCIFMGKVTANGKQGTLPVSTCFRNNLVFTDCDFRGEVDFEKTIVFGMVNFSKSVFGENANFNSMSVWSKDSYFSEVKAEKSFSMIYASFYGNVYFLDARFEDKASFQESSFKGKLNFNNSIFLQGVGFDLMEVCGAAFFNYAVFENNVDFSFSRFLYTTEFINPTLKGKANFEKTFFLNTVRFEGIDTDRLILTETFYGNKTH